jgi:hypothetical protein
VTNKKEKIYNECTFVACRDPININRLASSLVRAPNSLSGIHGRTELGVETESGRPWGQVFYISDPEMKCLV